MRWARRDASGLGAILNGRPDAEGFPWSGETWLKMKQKDYRVKERGFYDPQRV